MSQNWIVAVLVGVAAFYAIWYVLPAAARQHLGRLHRALGRAPACTSSCGSCGKCSASSNGESAKLPSGQEQPVTFFRKL
ncbi:hypothetical protein [Rhodoferax sp.]|uniref:hypothetical protein n=1 Tax=Rhodoferax sp. TaxID=50421 RepID=UPI002841608D|nr:hypothetical protein [Rhodoferax sp.]MDR3369390.1 hypothetical protein [Rhodoferax sp.]